MKKPHAGLRDFDALPVLSSSQACIRGVLLVACSQVLLWLYLYAAVVSKLDIVPWTDNWLLDSVKRDDFHCYSVPLFALPLLAGLYLKWVACPVLR